jgi:hypothetical protein
LTINFSYNKGQVLQALRFHFLSRREIRLMVILVNVFAILSAVLFYFQRILPFALLVGSFLWFAMMISVWFILPNVIYRRAATFKDHFRMQFDEQGFDIGNERSATRYEWIALTKSMETPHFFYFYFSPQSFFLVPKNAFDDEGISEMRRLLRERVNRRG